MEKHLHILVETGKYDQAIPLYLNAIKDAKAAHSGIYTVKFLLNLSVCQFAKFQFRSALQTMTGAVELAKHNGDRRGLAMLYSNISSLFSQMGNMPGAAQAAEDASRYAANLEPDLRVLLLAQLGLMRAQTGNLAGAEMANREAIDIALGLNDPNGAAWAWDSLGYVRLKAHRYAEAEAAATEGFRLRKLFPKRTYAIDSSYLNLGVIKAARGDPKDGLVLLDAAERALSLPAAITPPWRIYMERGKIKLSLGELQPALEDLRTALHYARDWRVDVPANDVNRRSSEGTLAELYDLLVEAGNRLDFVKHDPALVRETFEVAEENRAASLRSLLPQQNGWRSNLTDRYYVLLAQVQANEAAGSRDGSAKASAALVRLRAELEQIEANAGAPFRHEQAAAAGRINGMLDANSVLFSFQLGDSHSWVWVVTKQGISVHLLPGRAELNTRIGRLEKALVSNTAGAISREGRDLYEILFESLGPEVAAHERWLLELDGNLFDLPFAALRTSGGRFLIEDHSLEIEPRAVMAQGDRNRSAGGFLGVGDPIYNRADSRARKNRLSWPSFLLRVNEDRSPGFARLWGTGRELVVSQKAWDAPSSVLLTGEQASPEIFWRSIRAQPDIIHIATHVIESNTGQQSSWIAFSLDDRGKIQYITPEEIQAKTVSARLVVLSGCSSGKAEVRTATGLMGLTRAWIAAGAGAVLATRWPTVDDDGAFFESFYRNLRMNTNINPAEALRKASLEMLKSGTWRATPSFWAGYFLVGNS